MLRKPAGYAKDPTTGDLIAAIARKSESSEQARERVGSKHGIASDAWTDELPEANPHQHKLVVDIPDKTPRPAGEALSQVRGSNSDDDPQGAVSRYEKRIRDAETTPPAPPSIRKLLEGDEPRAS